MHFLYDSSVGDGVCGGRGVCVGDWVGDGMVVRGGPNLIKEIPLQKFYKGNPL